ncbi:AsmA-like C-terminal region-containing protein [Falsihalocynthiibacter sp. SS001]|uniref:AsmA-like C-terminal region-containing protein n=1 Tax=Falsihalocynthiibacter sp. SS001 TaxID=3349698 RepID=UPI0036D3EDCF
MAQQEGSAITEQQKKRPLKRHHKIGLATVLIVVAAIAAVLGAGFVALKRGVNAPTWMIEQVETRLNQSLDSGVLALGGLRVELLEGWSPELVLTDVVYLGEDGRPLAQVDRVHSVFAAIPLFSPEVLPRRVSLSGADISLRRDRSGAFNISLGDGNYFASMTSVKEVILGTKALFEVPFLEKVEDISLNAFDFELYDELSDKIWKVNDAALVMNLAGGQIDIISSFALTREQSEPAQIAISLSAPKTGLAGQVTMNVENVSSRDIAVQSAALSWLGVLEAPISGALRTELLDDGTLGDLNGTLEIGAGALQPTPDARPVPFSEARTYFSYDAARAKINFDLIEAKSEAGEVKAEGFAYLQDWDGARPSTMITQLQFQKVIANPGNLLLEPAVFDGGALDFRLRLDPFTATIGQLSLTTEARKFYFDGEASVDPKGWDLAVNARLNTIDHDSLLALWPVQVAPRTRKWLNENVSGGAISNVVAAIRKPPEEPPRASLGYDFTDAQVRYLKTLPPVSQGQGYVSLNGTTMTISVANGHVNVPNGKVLDVAGTVITMPDVTLRPSPMDVTMKVRGTIPTALSLLDMEPFEFVSKAGQTVEIAQGTADLTARFQFDIVKKVDPKDVTFDVQGRLLDVTSDLIVPSKQLSSEQLDLTVTRAGLRIAGAGRVGSEEAQVPFNVVWEQPFGIENKGKSRVTGDIELSQEFADAFGIGLPNNMLSGAGTAQIEINMERDQPPAFSLTSDLNNLGLRLGEIGWSSPRNATGVLKIAGTLGRPVRIDEIALSASGLNANGSIEMRETGGLKVAQFDRVTVGRGINIGLQVVGNGRNTAPTITVQRGELDLRSIDLPTGSGGGSGGGFGLNLDRLVLSDGMALHGFTGKFSRNSGLNGTFSGRVNGAADVTGTVAPSENGTAIRMRSKDAGAVLRAAGLYANAHGGEMDLVLAPRGPSGEYDGRFVANTVRIKNAPGMAALLGAISVVGLLEQLQESGILFNELQADFHMTPQRLTLKKSSAVGASVGLSLDGLYDFASGRVAMNGVISPIYLLNGIGSVFTRKGEGLFGFSFAMTGTAKSPKISVNPFSILTPGMFREIFRAPPPKTQ